MQQEIEDFIRSSYEHSKADLMLQSFELFEEAQLEDYEGDFLEILMEEGSIDATELPDQFFGVMLSTLLLIVKAHGVKLQAETPHWIVNEIVRGLMAIEYYLDPVEMIRVTEGDSDNEEQLAEMLYLVTGTESGVLVQYIEDMNTSLLKRVVELFTARVIEDPDKLAEDAAAYKLVARVKDISRFMADRNLLAMQLIERGVLAGANFDEYLHYIHHLLDDSVPDVVAKELFAIFSLSRDGSANMLDLYREKSEIIFHDADRIFQVKSRLIKLQTDFDKYMLERKHIMNQA